MIINIFKMRDGSALYGDVIEDQHTIGDTFDRFYIYPSGRVEICERTEDPRGDIATETETYELLHTLLEKPTIEHTLSRFYGNYDIVFNWHGSITS